MLVMTIYGLLCAKRQPQEDEEDEEEDDEEEEDKDDEEEDKNDQCPQRMTIRPAVRMTMMGPGY